LSLVASKFVALNHVTWFACDVPLRPSPSTFGCTQDGGIWVWHVASFQVAYWTDHVAIIVIVVI